MKHLMLAIVLACAAISGHAEQKSLASAYQDFSCGEIREEHERVIGRINELEISGIKGARGEAEAAVAKLLVFWPAMFMSGSAGNLDELSALKRIAKLQLAALDEKECNGRKRQVDVMPVEQKAVTGSDRDYEIALEEIERGRQVRALWARALAASNGSEISARSIYIRLRVEQLAGNGSK